MKNKVFILCRLPGSGKSTWANKKTEESFLQNLKIQNYKLDKEFFLKYGKDYDGKRHEEYENVIKSEIYKKIEEDLKNGFDVILDFGFWKKEERLEIKNKIENLEAECVLVFFDFQKEVLLERLNKRNSDKLEYEYIIPKIWMNDFEQRFEKSDKEEDFILINENVYQTVSEVYDEILNLYKNYCMTHRRVISLDKYLVAKEVGVFEQDKPDQKIIIESLLEHVGVLPIVATFLYPHLHNKDKIDFGKVLLMLAIHDIGETVNGDLHPHRKTEKDIFNEQEAAKNLLNKRYHETYDEFENQQTLEAKFAKAVDVFSTFLADLFLPTDLVKERLKIYDFSWQLFEEKRRSVFMWDFFLNELFDEIIERYKKINI